jgi:hypothetical protein
VAPAMSLANWTVAAGTFRTFSPPDRAGTYLRQSANVDWGIESNTAIVSTTASFSVYEKRGRDKNYALTEYLTVALHETDVERKIKFWRSGQVDILDMGSLVQTISVPAQDRQRWQEAQEVVLDFYTVSNEGQGLMVISSPLFSQPLVVTRISVEPAKVGLTGNGQALVACVVYTFPTSGTITLPTLSAGLDGTAGATPALRVFPSPPAGNSVVLDSIYWTGDTFVATLRVSGDGSSPVPVQALEFGWGASVWSAPDPTKWQDISGYVVSASERVGEELHDREVTLKIGLRTDSAAAAFRALWLACQENTLTREVAFRHTVETTYGDVLVDRYGIMRLADEAHPAGETRTISASVYSRLAVQGEGDAINLPLPYGSAATFWPAALRVLRFPSAALSNGDTSSMTDPGWGYDADERGSGQKQGEYLRELARNRGYVLDDRETTLTIRRRYPVSYETIALSGTSPVPALERYDDLGVEVDGTDYANAVEVRYTNAAGIPSVARAYCPALIAADGRVVPRVINSSGSSVSPEEEASDALWTILQRHQRVSIKVPPFGNVTIWPGVCRVTVAPAEQFGTQTPAGAEFEVMEVDTDLEGDAAMAHISPTIVGRRIDPAGMPTIATLTAHCPEMARGATETATTGLRSPWEQQRKEKKKPHTHPGDRARYGRHR